MAENIGLGEAISQGTRLSGDWGSPVTKGFQLGKQYELAELQRQQQEQARLEKDMDNLGKHVTFDNTKWYNPERARKVKGELDKINAEMYNAWKSGDKMKVYELENKAKFDVIGMNRIVDNDERALNEGDKNSITRRQAQSIYGTKGVEGLIEHNAKYPFAPIAQIDEESGSFKVRQVKDPNINKYLGREIKTQLETLAPTKRAGTAGNANVLTIDINSPEYKNAKIEVINKALNDKNFVADVVYTQDFKDYYDKFLQKVGIDYEEADNMDLDDALKGFMLEKYDQNEYIKPILQKQATPKGGGKGFDINFNSGKSDYQFKVDPNNEGVDVEMKNNQEAYPKIKDINNVTYEVLNPTIFYMGDGKFAIEYFKKRGTGGKLVKQPAIVVNKSQMDREFDISEQGYNNLFPKYKAEKEKVTKQPAPKGSAAPAPPIKKKKEISEAEYRNLPIAERKNYTVKK